VQFETNDLSCSAVADYFPTCSTYHCIMKSDENPFAHDVYWYIYSRVPRLTVEVIVHSSAGVLMTLRNIDPCRGLWHLPGGTVRFGERLTEAVQRIARRELRISVQTTRLLGYIEYPSHYENGLDCPVGIVFEALAYSGTPRANEEARGVAWFTDLPSEMHTEQADFLELVLPTLRNPAKGPF
jgi:ADP-ribose pyrophosphatase YjhB (NUDIX family)